MDYREFAKKCFEGLPKNEMLPNGTDPQEGLKILIKHFIGDFIVTGYPCSKKQWNSEAIYEVLRLYPQGSIKKIKPRY